MKRIFAFVAAAMLLAGPAFADSTSQSATVYRGNSQGTQTNVVNRNTVKDVTAINAGKNNSMDFGVVGNKGGSQTNIVNQNEIKGSTFINAGEGNAMRAGGVYNE